MRGVASAVIDQPQLSAISNDLENNNNITITFNAIINSTPVSFKIEMALNVPVKVDVI